VVGSQVRRRVFFLTHPWGAYTAQLAGSCARQEFRTRDESARDLSDLALGGDY